MRKAAPFLFITSAVFGQSVLGPISISPTFVPQAAATNVTFTLDLRGVATAPLGINLIRVDAVGAAIGTPLGTFRDDGDGGDAEAGDKVYTARVPVTPPGTGRLFFRASAAFAGALLRSLSSIAGLDAGTAATPLAVTNLTVPSPNAAGWNSANLIVYFVCSGGAGNRQTCPAPEGVVTETASQVVSGVATDGAGNSVPRNVTVKLDKTPPVVAIQFPPNNSTQPSPLTVLGSLTEPLSGLASVACNGVPGTVDALAFACPVSLPPGTSTVAVEARDRAGNVGKGSVQVTRGEGSPTISDFNPKSAPAGTLVTVSGTNLAPNPEVTLTRQGGGTITAPVGNASATSLSFTIPPGATTGTFSVTVDGKPGASPAPLTIVSSKTFTISALPANADLVRGHNISYAVRLSSTTGFGQLALLNVTGVPTGMTASFKPLQITAGQTSILTLTAPAGQPVGTAPLAVSASVTVDGLPLSETASVQVSVIEPTTSFVGRTVVDDPLQTPLAGVTVTMLGKDGNGGTTGCTGTTISDAAGNFALRGLPGSCTGRQLVGYDGLTVTSPAGKYAGVNLVYTLASGQVTASPVLVHLPRIDDKETFFVKQNHTEDQSYSYKSIPGLSLIVYKGTTFTLPGGARPDPFPLVAVQVPVDRLPDSKPPVPTMMLVFIVAFQPANSVASQPVAVYYPNTLNSPPGQNMPLLTLDPTRGSMMPYGTGTASPDGTQVIPDLIPGGGAKRWGIVNFDWHGQMPNPPDPETNPSPTPGDDHPPCDPPTDGGGDKKPSSSGNNKCCGCSPGGGDPVDLATGLMVYNVTDLSLRGTRGSIAIQRIYRSTTVLALTNNRPFGPNTNHNYNYSLGMDGTADPAQIVLIQPDNSRIVYSRQSAGVYVNGTAKTAVGSVLRILGGGKFSLRYKNGNVMEFEAAGALVAREAALVDPNGNRISIERNPANLIQVLSITDPVGRQIRFTYDGSNRVTAITDPIGRTVTYTYLPEAPGMLGTVTDPEGGVTRYEYSGTALIREFNARNIKEYENTYSGFRVSQQTAADGGVYSFHYQFYNVLAADTSPILNTTMINPNGRRTSYRFDPEGQIVQVTHQDEHMVYAASEARLAEGKSRIFVIQPFPKRVKAIRGDVRCAVCGDARAGDVESTFDDRGNLTTSKDSLGNVSMIEYEPTFNRPTALTNAIGNRSELAYDGRGNLTSSKDPNSNVTQYAHNSFGQITEVTNALNQKTKFEYDAFGNMIAVTDALGNESQFRYDAVSRLVETVDPLGRRAQTFYDKLDRVIKRIDGRGVVTEFAYDPMGNLLTLTDGRGKNTTFTYDSMNRLATRTDPLGKTDFRTYDLLGNLIKFVDRKAQTSEFKYDQENRLIEEKYVDALVKRTYDAAGRLVRIDDSQSGVFTMSYDAAGRLLSSAGPTGTINYARDALGRVTTRQVIGGATVSYLYDAASNLTSATMPDVSVSYGYDRLNRAINLTRGNGVDTQHVFDPAGRLLNITHRKGATALAGLNYTYDAAGSRISQQSNIGQPLVTKATLASFDDGNQILARAGSTFTHDANGNLASENDIDGLTTYSWDGRNRLSGLGFPSGRSLAFTYDPYGLLLKYSDGTTVRDYVSDDALNTAEFRVNGERASILAGRAVDSHLAVSMPSSAYYLIGDAINTTVASVDSSGAFTNQIKYEPFGGASPADATQEGFSRFTGRVQITERLLYYRARFYSAISGRFLNQDPIGFAGGINLYSYVQNNPITSTDPFGLTSSLCFWVDDWFAGCVPDPGGRISVSPPPSPRQTDRRRPRQTPVPVDTGSHHGPSTLESLEPWRVDHGAIPGAEGLGPIGLVFGPSLPGTFGKVIGYLQAWWEFWQMADECK